MAKDVPKGKWSLHYDRCVLCGTNKIPHKADGLCRRCYLWIYRQKKKLGFVREKGKVIGKPKGKKQKQSKRGVPKEAK